MMLTSSGHKNPKNMRLNNWPRNPKTQLLIVAVIFILTLYLTFNWGKYQTVQNNCAFSHLHSGQLADKSSLQSRDLPLLKFPDLSPLDYHQLCFPSLPLDTTIGNTFAKFQALSKSEHQVCQDVWAVASRIYRLSKSTGEVILPDGFVSEVKQWLNGDEKLFKSIGSQDVYTVVNKIYGEASVYNTLRSKRPVSKPPMDPAEYIEKVVTSTKESCDFCKFRQHTAQDVFGRVISEHSASASNTFKMAKFHGLFFPFGHHPLNLTFPALADLFLNTTVKWFDKAFQQDNSQIYPVLLWDALPHAGASQVHPHIHGLLDPHEYLGAFGVLNAANQDYFDKFRTLLWSDIILVHWALGLVVVEGQAVALAPLTARKDYEYLIISQNLSPDSIKLLWRVLQTYRKKLGVYCFSSGGSLPVLRSPSTGLPFIFRIGSRGDCSAVRSDVSSLELYTVNNINTDLDKTVQALKDS